METIQQSPITLKLIFQQNWNSFLAVYPTMVTWTIAYNVWKIMNCREPDGLGFSTFRAPDLGFYKNILDFRSNLFKINEQPMGIRIKSNHYSQIHQIL